MQANKRDGKEGRVCALRTEDGGASWSLASYLGPEPEGYQIMPASVRLKGGAILTATRTSGPAELSIGVRRPLPSPDARTTSYLLACGLPCPVLNLFQVLTTLYPSNLRSALICSVAAGEEVRPRLLD